MTKVQPISNNYDVSKASSVNSAKKNVATVGIIGGYLAGHNLISKATYNRSFGWNSAINKGLKSIANKVSNFKGGEIVGNIATKIAKATPRQKALAAFTMGAAALLMATREHFAKKAGKIEVQS